MINQQILNYKIVSLIGEGGMGDVYLGEHVSINRKVAIKVLKPELAKNEEIRNRFKNEAAMLAHLQHPNIVGLIDYVEQEDGLYLIMEYVEGKGLDELIKEQQSPLSIERSLKLMTQVLQAFQYAHENGIVHRDVKPSNILVTPDDRIKVLDFGIAKLLGNKNHQFTRTGTQIGTVYYMSPEQVKGSDLDRRSDIYSLGVTFYEILSGSCPYRIMTTEYEIFDNIVKVPLLPLTETMGSAYSQVWSAIEKATQKDRNDRFSNCEEFIKGIEKGVVQKQTTQHIKTEKKAVPSYDTDSGSGSKKWLIVLLIFAGLFSLGYLLVADSGENEKSWTIETGKAQESEGYTIYYSYYAPKDDSLLPYQIKVNELIREFVLNNSFVTEDISLKNMRLNKDFFSKVLINSKIASDQMSSEYESSINDSIYIDTNFNLFDQVIMSMWGYQAGGTGWEVISHKLVDKETSKILELQDFVNDVPQFTIIAEKCFRKQKGLVGFDGFSDEYTFENSKFYCPKNFYLKQGNFFFTYEKYEISYGAAGSITFQVPISEISHLLSKDLSTKIPMENIEPKDAETQIPPITQDEVSSIMTNYYYDITNEDFNAFNYYAENVQQFIRKMNVSPEEINEINQGSGDMTQRSVFFDSQSLAFDRVEENVQFWRYSIYFVCYKESRGQYQSCNVNIEVGFNQEKKLTVYNELRVSNLEYTDYNPNEVGD